MSKFNFREKSSSPSGRRRTSPSYPGFIFIRPRKPCQKSVLSQKIEKKFFQLDLEKKIFEPSIKEFVEEHPYEVYAYKIADELNK
jgi:hypothetical protein